MLPVFLLSQFLRMSLQVSQRSLSPPPLASPHSWLLPAQANVECLASDKCHLSLVTWLNRNLRGDTRGSWVARSRLRFSCRHTETAERLGVTLNQPDVTQELSDIILDNLQCQPVCFLEFLQQLEFGHGELLGVGLLAVAALNRCLGDCFGSSISPTFLISIRILLLWGLWSRVFYAVITLLLLTSEKGLFYLDPNITNSLFKFAESFYIKVLRNDQISKCFWQIFYRNPLLWWWERDDFLTCLLWSFDIYREMKTRHAEQTAPG